MPWRPRPNDRVLLKATRGNSSQGYQLSREVADELAGRLSTDGWTVSIGPVAVDEPASPQNSLPWPDELDGQEPVV